MEIIAFDTEVECQFFCQLAWTGTVKKAVQEKEIAKDSDGKFLTELSGLTDGEIKDLSIVGHLDGSVYYDNGETIGYANPSKAYKVEKWYVPAPRNDVLDLSFYDIIDLPDSWKYPDEFEEVQ